MSDQMLQRDEQRLVLRLLAHWRALAGDRPMPAFEDFDLRAVPDLWKDSFLIDARTPAKLAFHAVGNRHIDALSRNPGGHDIATLDKDTLLGRAVANAASVLERRVPITVGGQFADAAGRTHLFRSILLPLTHDGGFALLGGANSRVVVLQ